MSTALQLVIFGSLLALVPAQAKEIATRAKGASSMTLETGEACSGLSPQECCGQMLELAGFRALGDQLPRKIKTTVRLACMDADKTVTRQVCRSIAISRGFASKRADAICKPAQRECRKDGTCKKCVSDLLELDYRGGHNACRALTYVPDRSRTRVVVIRDGGEGDESTRFEVTRRRTTLR